MGYYASEEYELKKGKGHIFLKPKNISQEYIAK